MGSLPNLHTLEHVRRTPESDHTETSKREPQQRAREHRDTSRERETLPVFLHPQLPFNPQLLTHTFDSIGPTTSGGTPGQVPKYHHRHSLTTRRVLRTRSSGATYNVWDDPMIEHMAAYSPISTRSHRISVVPPYQVQQALAGSRRRDSLNSSIGANSIRRLLTLNNRNCRHKVPLHVRTKICKNFTLLAVAHGLLCAILVPLVGLQGSNSIWHHREQWIHVGPNIGSMLLSISFLISSGMCFLTTRLIQKLGYTILIGSGYMGMCFFLVCHLLPSIYTLIPAYVILGITLGPAWVGKFALIMFYANKLSCMQHECNLNSAADALEDHKVFCNRDQKVRRLGRLFHAAQDIGIILGASIAAVVMACASTDSNCFFAKNEVIVAADSYPQNITNVTATDLPENNKTSVQMPRHWLIIPTRLPTDDMISDELYNHNEHGERICGADLCPVWSITKDQAENGTFYANFVRESGKTGGLVLIVLFIPLAIAALSLTCLSGRTEKSFRSERVKGMTDTLMFAGPMAYFIGTEQGYMLGDFTRAYVSCSLGVPMVAGALVGMGIMQAIVSCTLSMLLRHTKRIVVLAAGFFFHACLLLVLSRWKPSNDDSALFYVIAASWGACNAMWETLLFALVTLTHTNHIAEIVSPLQALKFLGLGITFAAHGFLCENPKILILVIVLVLSVPPYAMLEIRLEGQRKAQMISL